MGTDQKAESRGSRTITSALGLRNLQLPPLCAKVRVRLVGGAPDYASLRRSCSSPERRLLFLDALCPCDVLVEQSEEEPGEVLPDVAEATRPPDQPRPFRSQAVGLPRVRRVLPIRRDFGCRPFLSCFA